MTYNHKDTDEVISHFALKKIATAATLTDDRSSLNTSEQHRCSLPMRHCVLWSRISIVIEVCYR